MQPVVSKGQFTQSLSPPQQSTNVRIRFHSEGSIISTLFGLLFWDILFAPVPGAFEAGLLDVPRWGGDGRDGARYSVQASVHRHGDGQPERLYEPVVRAPARSERGHIRDQGASAGLDRAVSQGAHYQTHRVSSRL